MNKRKLTFPSFLAVFTIIIILTLACSFSTSTETTGGDTSAQQTMAALSIAETVVSVQQTQAASTGGNVQPPPVSATVASPPTSEPPPPAAPTQDMTTLIKNAKILLYEDTWNIGTWVYDTVKVMGLTATYDGDAIGHWLEHLNSTQWDLIILVGESHDAVQGEIWDQIMMALNGSNKPALIAEIWYLNEISEGRIKTFTNECGVKWQKDIPSAVPIFWLAPDSPFYNNPVTVPSLTGPGGYWVDAGDEVALTAGSKATLLAGTSGSDKSNHGVITSCFDGRVILQTFCDHDFSRGTIQPLWKNYITNVLTAHFKAIQ